MMFSMTLNQHNINNFVIITSLKSQPTCKLINRIAGFRLLISSLPGPASRMLSKPCLVNVILKDNHLVFYIYRPEHKIWYLLDIHKGNKFGLGQRCIGSSTVPRGDSFDCCTERYEIVIYYCTERYEIVIYCCTERYEIVIYCCTERYEIVIYCCTERYETVIYCCTERY